MTVIYKKSEVKESEVHSEYASPYMLFLSAFSILLCYELIVWIIHTFFK